MLYKIKNNKHFHIIFWFPKWLGFSYERLRIDQTSYALIYEWCICLGFIEIRKWKPRDRESNFI